MLTNLSRCQHALVFVLSISAAALPYQVAQEPGLEKLAAAENILWTDPGDVASLDVGFGIGGLTVNHNPHFNLPVKICQVQLRS